MERSLTNTSMIELSVADLIQRSQGVQQGTLTSIDEIYSESENSENENSDSENSDTDKSRSDAENDRNELEDEYGGEEIVGPSLRIVWRFERLLADKKELQEFFNEEGCWTAGPKRFQNRGFKITYRCKKSPKAWSSM